MEHREDLTRTNSDGLTPVTDIDIKALAEIYDERDVYLSLYLPTATREDEHANHHFVASRIKTIKKALPHDLRDNFQDTLATVEDFLFQKPISGERGKIVFASAPHDFLRVYRIGLEPQPLMVLDTSPYLLPLARMRDDYQDYGVLLLDSREARLFCIRSDFPEEMDHLSVDLMNKHKKGGWSQMRFNRLRKGAVHAFLSEVVEDVAKLCDQHGTRGLVIAGPGEAKNQLREMLPPPLEKKVLGLVDLSMNTTQKELVEEGDRIAHQGEISGSKARAEELRGAILRGGLAVHGVEEVRDALAQGRVNVLILLKDLSMPGWICERCQNLHARSQPPATCPQCGGPTARVDVVEELYELAQRTDAEVEFVEEDDFLESVGGLGALLRY